MNHIVFMVGSYYPYYSAVGACIGNVAKELEKDEKVTVLCFESRSGQAPVEQYGAQTIVRVSTPRMKTRNRLEENAPLTPVRKFIHRGIYFIKTVLSRESVDRPLVAAYAQALKNLGHIDIIVPACSPFETAVAAVEYKQSSPDVKIMPFLFDPFSASGTLHRTEWSRKMKMRRHLALEKEMLECSQRVLFVDAWRSHLEKYFPAYRSKCCMVEHPLVVPISSYERFDFEKRKMHIVYTGLLHTSARPPAYTLRLFQRLCEKEPAIAVHMFTLGNCETMVRSLCAKNPGRMIHHGSVSKSRASAALLAGDFLLSIGNRDAAQVPSKVFEYMSCGKPIIHLYIHPQDPALPILAKYPLALCLQQDENAFGQNMADILDFLYENKGKTVPFDTVAALFHTALPAYSAGRIIAGVRS
jgi:hypothetical protein